MTKRIYTGSSSSLTGKIGSASSMKRLEIQKGGKLAFSSSERYRQSMKAKTKGKSQLNGGIMRNMPTLQGVANRKMSKTAQQALDMIEKKKQLQEEKRLRQMVAIHPRVYPNAGRVDTKGRGFDIVDGQVLKIDPKTGKMKTSSGWYIGKYKPKSFMTHQRIHDALIKFSPHQQRLLALKRAEELAKMYEQMGTVNGAPDTSAGTQGFSTPHYDAQGNLVIDHNHPYLPLNYRAGAGMSAHGAVSNNVHGTFSENVWGGMVDNVWGSTYSDVWGNVSGNSIWGDTSRGSGWGSALWGKNSWGRSLWGKGNFTKFWGSGTLNQKNHLGKLVAMLTGGRLGKTRRAASVRGRR